MKIYKLLKPLSLALLMGTFCCQGSFAQTGGEDELSYRDQVQIMYVAYYGRPGDAGGLDFWAGKLEEVNGNLMEIINEFGTSMEFTERFGDLDDEELVDNIFLQLLGKNADSGGLNFYVNGIREGRFTLASIALNVADGTNEKPEGRDNTVKTNKLRAANAFSEAYVEAGADYGEFQIDDAKLWLGEVDSTEASVTAALDRLPDLVEMFSGGTTPEPVEDFAPVDQAAFARLVDGKRITGDIAGSITFTASRFTETGPEGTDTGTYTYSRTGMNTATLELTYDGDFNGRSVSMLTFITMASGTYSSTYTETGSPAEMESGNFSLEEESAGNFAPVDQAAFANLVAGRTIGGFGAERYTFTASRFTETGPEGTFTGSYTYRRTGMNTATLELTYDGDFNGRSVSMLTFLTPTSGTYTSMYTETGYSESGSGSFSF